MQIKIDFKIVITENFSVIIYSAIFTRIALL